MTAPVLIVTRPVNDARQLIASLNARGIEAIPAPLIEIAFRADARIPGLAFQTVLVTSANGCRALGKLPGAQRLCDVLTIAVGEMSAQAARDIGQVNVEVAGGDVAALIAKTDELCDPAGGALLYVSGVQTTGDLQAQLAARGYDVHRIVAYEAVAADALPVAAQSAVATQRATGAVLYSPRTAHIWCKLLDQAELVSEGAQLTHFCLSENVAAVIRGAFGNASAIVIADEPREQAMIAAIADATR